jgi:ATPase subunit of ABC transporter with duplicated ATPase domains
LKNYEGTLVVVSHDREFLQTIVTDIIHFTKKRLDYYPTDFESYEKIREEKRLKKIHLQENLDRVRDYIKDFMKKMEQAAQKNPLDQKRQLQIASRKKKLMKVGVEKTEDGKKWKAQAKRMGYRVGSINANGGGWKDGQRTAASIVEAEEKGITFNFPTPEPLGNHGPLITMKDVSFSYQLGNNNNNVLSNVNLRIDQAR